MGIVSEALAANPELLNSKATLSSGNTSTNFVQTQTDQTGKPLTYWGGNSPALSWNYTNTLPAPTTIEKIETLVRVLDAISRASDGGYTLEKLLKSTKSKLGTLIEEL